MHNAELTGNFSTDNGDEVDGYPGEFTGRTFGSRGAERRRTEQLAGDPATRHSRGDYSSHPVNPMPLNTSV